MAKTVFAFVLLSGIMCFIPLSGIELVAKERVRSDGLDSVSRRALRDALEVQGMTERELGFYKFWAVDSFFRLRVVERLLSRPLEVLPYVESVAGEVRKSTQAPARLMLGQVQTVDIPVTIKDTLRLWREIDLEVGKIPPISDSLPGSLKVALQTIFAGFEVGNRYLQRAIANISERELNILLGEAPGFWQDEDDTLENGLRGELHREFGKDYDTSQEIKAETLLTYARKIDRRDLALSGLAVVLATTRATAIIDLNECINWHPEGNFNLETKWGTVILGGNEDNIYKGDAAVIIDVSGNDHYYNRAGGAVGVLSFPFGVVIDLGGDDCYLSERLFSQGAALFGCGVLIDRAGDDVYRCRHYGQGGAIFGSGVLWDNAGRDVYDAGFFAQGAGHYGFGILVDNEGNDSYRSFCYCQGFAGTWGYGLLAEAAGNDVYYAGGQYRHEPLLPREYRSFSQGFAIGVRPDAGGGVGFLCDFNGNDFYNSEVFTQGTSYWYSLGVLYDGEGFDHYSAQQYSQGAGIHLSVGALVDEEGNDSYFSRLGPSQGEGHDLSVGVLVDRKGDDGYYASGGQGIGLTNSVGLFLDADGNDWYMASESLICQGSSNWARGFGGIGVFIDLAGKDQYPARNLATNDSRWTKGTYGSGIDLPRPATVIDYEPEVDTSEASIDSVITAPVESVFKTASMWAVGNVRKKVLRARKELIRLGKRAVVYVYEKKLDTKDGLESEAVLALVKALPDTAKPYLLMGLRDERFLARQNSAYWLGEMGEAARDAVDSILLALKEKRITPRRAVYALGSIGDSTVVPEILYLLKDTLEISRIVTAEACGKLKNPRAINPLILALGDPFFTVRSAAEAALVAIGKPAFDSLLIASANLSSPALGHALRVLGNIVTKLDTVFTEVEKMTCQEVLLKYISHQEPFVRLSAVAGLGKMMLSDVVRAKLETAKEKERDPFVLTVYEQVLDVKRQK